MIIGNKKSTSTEKPSFEMSMKANAKQTGKNISLLILNIYFRWLTVQRKICDG
jgi:hypothetical protein